MKIIKPQFTTTVLEAQDDFVFLALKTDFVVVAFIQITFLFLINCFLQLLLLLPLN
jgi:hypothetical protein